MNGGNGAVPIGEELSHGLGEFLFEVSDCRSLEIIALERLRGGAVQENYALDVHFGGGSMAGRQELVLRTDAPSGVLRLMCGRWVVLSHTAHIKIRSPLAVHCPMRCGLKAALSSYTAVTHY